MTPGSTFVRKLFQGPDVGLARRRRLLSSVTYFRNCQLTHNRSFAANDSSSVLYSDAKKRSTKRHRVGFHNAFPEFCFPPQQQMAPADQTALH